MRTLLKPLRMANILPNYLPIRFSIEQLSYMLIAIEHEVLALESAKQDALDMNDTLYNVKECDRRIRLMNRAHRAITESIDS